MIRATVLLFVASSLAWAQEAGSGFDLRVTLTGLFAGANELTASPRSGSPAVAGFRSVLYPSWKLSPHWIVSGAYEVYSRPYFYESFSTQGYGIHGSLIQGWVGYSNKWHGATLLVRAGELSSAFGSYLLRYDDAVNPLVDMPAEYGYYYSFVSIQPVAGAQVDVTAGRWDGRAQFANSSPVNPRSIFVKDQYGNWTGGLGYTVRQGLRIGASAFRGPYLDRQSPFYLPGEAEPAALPATGVGVDAEYGIGHWNFNGEVQKFLLDYHAIPAVKATTGYGEVRRVLSPRWYVAARSGYLTSYLSSETYVETAAGFRPAADQLVKFSFEFRRIGMQNDPVTAVQYVATLHPLSVAFRN